MRSTRVRQLAHPTPKEKKSKAILISESNQKSKSKKKSKGQSNADSATVSIDSPRHLLLCFMALDRLISLACVAPFSLCCWLLLFLLLAHAPYAHRRSGEMYRSPMNAQMSSSQWKIPSGLLGLHRRLPVSRSKMAYCVRYHPCCCVGSWVQRVGLEVSWLDGRLNMGV